VLLKSDLDVQQTCLRGVFLTSKSDLRSTTKCDQHHIYDHYEFDHN
jgi:hypothetical protein